MEYGNGVTVDLEKAKNKIAYKLSLQILQTLKQRKMITDEQYAQIDALNRASFSQG
ncbi:MAG: SHOCT domain-containing protein [Bacillota bacterium]